MCVPTEIKEITLTDLIACEFMRFGKSATHLQEGIPDIELQDI